MSLTETLRLQPRRPGKYLQLQRVRPGVWLAWMIILLAILAAIFPQLLTHYDPESGVPGTQLMPRTAITGWGPISWAVISIAGSSTVPAGRCRQRVRR